MFKVIGDPRGRTAMVTYSSAVEQTARLKGHVNLLWGTHGTAIEEGANPPEYILPGAEVGKCNHPLYSKSDRVYYSAAGHLFERGEKCPNAYATACSWAEMACGFGWARLVRIVCWVEPEGFIDLDMNLNRSGASIAFTADRLKVVDFDII